MAWPGFRAVTHAPGGGRFIVPSSDDIVRIQKKHPFLKTLVVPAGSFPGQDQPITSVGSWSFVMARSSLADTVAYRVARALHRAETELALRLPAAAETTARNTVAALQPGAELHPGVRRYQREIKLLD